MKTKLMIGGVEVENPVFLRLWPASALRRCGGFSVGWERP